MTKISLQKLFLHLQGQLDCSLEASRSSTDHPGAKGFATEEDWRKMLSKALPKRYCVAKAFVIDSNSQRSDEIDLVIYDQQYSPLLFEKNGLQYIPAESVYAVFEVKQKLSRRNLRYACEKVESVRRLERTSVPIKWLGTPQKKELFPILGGMLCLESGWTSPFGDRFRKELVAASSLGQLDMVCALRNGTADITYGDSGLEIEASSPDTSLVFFFLRLLHRLQQFGTVPAIDLLRYGKAMED